MEPHGIIGEPKLPGEVVDRPVAFSEKRQNPASCSLDPRGYGSAVDICHLPEV